MLGHAIEKVLQRPVVIVMDQAQRLLVPDRGDPLPELVSILDYLRNRRTLKGRLLLLSDRDVTKAKWSEWIHKRTLKELKPEEAVTMFDARQAEEANSPTDIPQARKLRALQTLHYNPRAIEALVGRMRTRSLDAIMADDPGRWATEDAAIDPVFLRNLERDLLKQTMEELKELYQRKLWRLSVYRYNFQEEALHRVGGTAEETEDFRQQLFSRFFLNYQRGTLSLNPIVREISLSHLKSEPAELKQAHSAAAEYYIRFFNAKRILGNQSKLSEQYGELRYHLFNADRQDDLVAINRRYTEHLRQEIKAETPVPTQRQELNDRIEVLTQLLQEAGSKSLEYHLARCLEVRKGPGDAERALVHAERSADGDRHEDHWLLLATLTRQVQGDGKAIEKILHGLRTLEEMGAKAIVAPLYRLGAEILSESGKTREAIGLLRDGIQSIPSENNLFSLFELSAEISCRRRKPTEAIKVLREGIWRIEQRFGQQRLVICALLLSAAFENTTSLEEILLLPETKLGYSYATALSRVLVCEMEGDWAGAARIARNARKDFQKEIGLATHEALSLLAIDDNQGAQRALTSFHNFTLSEGSVGGWLEALIEVRRGNDADARRSLELFLNREVDPESELNVEFLLRLWDEQEGIRHGNRLCFNLPILPSSLTGLSYPVRRLQFTEPVLPSRPRVRTPEYLRGLHGSAATIYVSYAWGDDLSEAGRRREAIVEDLCQAVRASGRQVHRDKTKIKAGSSIDAFAREIAAADRIIAVLSEKSLTSELCMARELFRAYQRCGFHRGEFQQKVIAVVMDDARLYLKDRAAWAGLARHWKKQASIVSEELTGVDTRRVNEHVWHQGNLLEDMAERLPGMLEALCDTKMEQDLQVLAANKFWDVLSRLP